MGSYDHHKTRALIRKALDELKEIAMANADRVEAGLENISGDISRQGNEISQLSTDLGEARAQIAELLAGQDAAVAAAVDAKLGEVADKVEALAAVVPEPDPDQDPLPEG